MIRLALICDDERRETLVDCASRLDGVEIVDTVGTSDAVLVGSPPSEHATDCELAAAAGKHIVMTAPLAESTAQGERIVEACRRAGLCCEVELPARRKPSAIEVKASLDAGELGEPVLARIHRWECSAVELVDEIDLVCWWLGKPPERVYATGAPAAKSKGDYVQLHLGFDGGGMALIDVTERLRDGDGYYSASVVGTRGAAYADDHRDVQLLYGGGRAQALRADGRDARDDSLCAQWRGFVDAIEGSRASIASAEDALAALAVSEAVAASLAASRPAVRKGGRYELA